jgi:Skp family chaperone for outer membrane proteins
MEVTRELEDKNREINSELNKRAATIIAGLYDEIKIVVDKLAEKHGCQIVFAYPEGVTTEDFNNPYLKELKLKPSAAQPWYVSKQVDLTEEVIQSLNARHAAPHTLKSLVFPACLHLAQRH